MTIAVAVLFGGHLQRLGLGLGVGAALDGDSHLWFVPGRDLDGAVERLQLDVGLAGDGKRLLLLVDVLLGVQVDRAGGAAGNRERQDGGARAEVRMAGPFFRSITGSLRAATAARFTPAAPRGRRRRTSSRP